MKVLKIKESDLQICVHKNLTKDDVANEIRELRWKGAAQGFENNAVIEIGKLQWNGWEYGQGNAKRNHQHGTQLETQIGAVG